MFTSRANPTPKGVHPREVHLLRSVGRPMGRSVEGRMNGPGDRATKFASTREPSLSTAAKAIAPLRRMDVERVLPPGSQEFGTFKESFARKLGDLEGASPSKLRGQAAMGTRRAARHGDSLREVGRGHSTEEAGEDVGNARRVGGGKGQGHGESVAGNALSTQSENQRAHAMRRIGVEGGASHRLPLDPRWEPGAGNPPAGFCPGGRPKGRSLPERQTRRAESLRGAR